MMEEEKKGPGPGRPKMPIEDRVRGTRAKINELEQELANGQHTPERRKRLKNKISAYRSRLNNLEEQDRVME